MRSMGTMLGASRTNDFLSQTNGCVHAGGDHPSWRTDRDSAKRLTGTYGCSPTGSVRDIRGMTVATATRTAAYALVTYGVLSRAAVVCKTVG